MKILLAVFVFTTLAFGDYPAELRSLRDQIRNKIDTQDCVTDLTQTIGLEKQVEHYLRLSIEAALTRMAFPTGNYALSAELLRVAVRRIGIFLPLQKIRHFANGVNELFDWSDDSIRIYANFYLKHYPAVPGKLSEEQKKIWKQELAGTIQCPRDIFDFILSGEPAHLVITIPPE